MGKIYTVGGVTGTISDLCRYYNKTLSSVQYRIKKGLSLEEALSTGNSDKIDRIEYNVKGLVGTIPQLSKKFGISSTSVYHRLEKGMSLEDALLTKPRVVKKDTKEYCVNGVTGSLKELSKYFNIRYETVKGRIRLGYSVEDALLTPAREWKIGWSSILHTVDGVTGTVEDLDRYFDISFYTVKGRLDRGWSLEDALSKPIIEKNVYTVNGYTGSLVELCRHFEISYGTVYYRLSKGMSLEKALISKTPKSINSYPSVRGRIYTVRGVTGNISKLSDYFGISKNTVKCRLRKGMSPEEAFTKPVK